MRRDSARHRYHSATGPSLVRAVEREGKRLARRVRNGELTRADIEDAAVRYHDVETFIALGLLDKWGIR